MFFDLNQRPVKPLFPGVTCQTVWGERMMFSFVDFTPGSAVPPHSHPHEQMGIVLEGEFDLTIGSETRTLRRGDSYCAPGGVTHSVKAGPRGARALDVFCPVREDYK
jgi:quercetin dioxygenase-like cupin family protein